MLAKTKSPIGIAQGIGNKLFRQFTNPEFVAKRFKGNIFNLEPENQLVEEKKFNSLWPETKSPNVCKSCPKIILTPLQKLPKNACPKSNKSPNLVTLVELHPRRG